MDRYVTDIKNGCYQNPVLPMDFSDPDAIRRRFGVSKKTFKRAVGTLYRERKIAIESDSLRLLPEKRVFTRFRRKK